MVYNTAYNCLCLLSCYNETIRGRPMTDALLQHRLISQQQDFENNQATWNAATDDLSEGGDEYMLQLSKRIAFKQDGIRKIEADVLIMSDLQKRLGRTLALLPDTDDRNLRENQIYNALNYYLYGDTKEAVRYARAAGKKPTSFISRCLYGAKIRKSMVQLRWLFAFIDEKNCRQKLQNRNENEDFCAALDLFLNVRQPNSSAVDFLNRKMFCEYKNLRELKNLKKQATYSLNTHNAVLAHKNMTFAGKLSDQEVAALACMNSVSYA